MAVELLVNFEEFWTRLSQDIASAHDSVFVQRFAYLGGINFSEHNARWHDMMLRLDDAEAVSFLSEDFHSTWAGRDQVAHREFESLEVLTLDGRSNRRGFARLLDLIDGARARI